MALPKFSELSTGLQVLLILLIGVAVWTASEFLILKPVADANAKKQAQADQLAKQLAPLALYEQKQKQLVTENRQLEMQLENLRQIVPDEKEVDSFIRLVEGASHASGIDIRRFTSKPTVSQDYDVEVPFEVELDGPYYKVLNFFGRLGKMARIVTVSNLKMGGIHAHKSVGNKPYVYGPHETVVAVCTITTFFSQEQKAPPAKKPGRRVPRRGRKR